MVKSCCVIDCTARCNPGEQGFYRIPSENDNKRRQKWLNSIRRVDFKDRSKAWTPSEEDRVCKRHFLRGEPHVDPAHPDYRPHVYMGYPASEGMEKKWHDLERYERGAKRQKIVHVENSTTSSCMPPSEPVDSSDNHPTERIISDGETPVEGLYSQGTQMDDSCCSSVQGRVRELEDEIEKLQEKLQRQKETTLFYNTECVRLKEKIAKNAFTVENLTERQLKYFTGVRSHRLFSWIISVVRQRHLPTLCRKLSDAEKLLLILMKLRLGLQNKDLAYRFGINEDLCSKLFTRGVRVLSKALSFLIVWPEKGAIMRNVPKAFKQGITYKNTRTIIDCSEIFIQRPTNLLARNITYSNYKHHNTIKLLIGITPTGAISFLSKCWGGRVSDKELTITSGFLDQLEHGDQVMADRGFLIREELSSRGASLHIPAFTKGKNQLKRSEVVVSRKIANVRIHVERAIGRMKKFKILNTTWDLELVKNCNDIVVVIAALVNLLPPLVR